MSVLLGNGDGTFQPQVTYAVGTYPYALVAGDFNGDGRTDLAVANLFDGTVSVLLGNGDGTFQSRSTSLVGRCPTRSSSGDFNGDGRTDLAVTNYNDDTVSVLLGNGDGTFQTQVSNAVEAAARRDRGGRLQWRRPHRPGRRERVRATPCRFCWATATARSSRQVDLRGGDGPRRDRGGRLQRRRPHRPGRRQRVGQHRVGAAGQRRRHVPAPGHLRGGISSPTAIVAGDFNGDGRIDLAVAELRSSDTVSVLLGNGDGTFQPQVTYAVGSEPDCDRGR